MRILQAHEFIAPAGGSAAAARLIHFDQDDEQSLTDSGKKDGQNLSSQDWGSRGNDMTMFGLADIVNTGRFE